MPDATYVIQPSYDDEPRGLGDPNPLNRFARAATATAKAVYNQDLTQAVHRVRIRSQWTPEVVYDLTAPPGSAAAKQGDPVAKTLMSLVRPSIGVEGPAGTFYMEPDGPPRYNLFPVVVVAGAAVLGFAAYGLWKAIR